MYLIIDQKYNHGISLLSNNISCFTKFEFNQKFLVFLLPKNRNEVGVYFFTRKKMNSEDIQTLWNGIIIDMPWKTKKNNQKTLQYQFIKDEHLFRNNPEIGVSYYINKNDWDLFVSDVKGGKVDLKNPHMALAFFSLREQGIDVGYENIMKEIDKINKTLTT